MAGRISASDAWLDQAAVQDRGGAIVLAASRLDDGIEVARPRA
ncbi:MAG: hypothetical protein VCA57_17305 [Pseudomonas sp.]